MFSFAVILFKVTTLQHEPSRTVCPLSFEEHFVVSTFYGDNLPQKDKHQRKRVALLRTDVEGEI